MLSSYLGNFSGAFGISVIAWPFASFILSLPILALIYNRYHRLRLASALTAYLVVLYLMALVVFTLWPMPDDRVAFCATHHLTPQLDPLRFLQDLSADGRSALFQIIMNVVFFVPLGFIMGRVCRWKFYVAIPVGFLCSLFIETAQGTGVFGLVGCAYRLFDVDDLIWNTSGAIIGFLLAAILNRLMPTRQADAAEVITRPSFLHRGVTMAVDLIFSYALSTSLGMGIVYLIHRGAVYTTDGRYHLSSLTVSSGQLEGMVTVLNVAVLLVFEFLIPVCRHGQTLGASFTHMNIETKVRHGMARAAFYTLRTLLVVGVFGPWSGRFRQYMTILGLLLLVFYIFARQMPYDLIPGEGKDNYDRPVKRVPARNEASA